MSKSGQLQHLSILWDAGQHQRVIDLLVGASNEGRPGFAFLLATELARDMSGDDYLEFISLLPEDA